MKTNPFLHFLPELQVNTQLQQGPLLSFLSWMAPSAFCVTLYYILFGSLTLIPFLTSLSSSIPLQTVFKDINNTYIEYL